MGQKNQRHNLSVSLQGGRGVYRFGTRSGLSSFPALALALVVVVVGLGHCRKHYYFYYSDLDKI